MKILENLIEILESSWDILLDSAPYVLFGFFIAGLLKAFLPKDFINRHLGNRSRSSVLKAAFWVFQSRYAVAG